MNAAQAAALIAAVFWALLVSVGIFVLLRLSRLLSESTKLIARGDTILQRAQSAVDGAQAAVDRAHTQLDRTEPVTASMTELDAGMADLAGQVTALASLSRAITTGPVGRMGALAYGVRHAVSLRRAGVRNTSNTSNIGNVRNARGARRTLPGRVVERGELSRSAK